MACIYETENGLCEISGIPCKYVIICTPDTVYVYVDANYNDNEKEQANE